MEFKKRQSLSSRVLKQASYNNHLDENLVKTRITKNKNLPVSSSKSHQNLPEESSKIKFSNFARKLFNSNNFASQDTPRRMIQNIYRDAFKKSVNIIIF